MTIHLSSRINYLVGYLVKCCAELSSFKLDHSVINGQWRYSSEHNCLSSWTWKYPSSRTIADLCPSDWPPQPHSIHDVVLHVAVLLLQPNGETHPGQPQSCQSPVPVPPSISRTTPTERRGAQ